MAEHLYACCEGEPAPEPNEAPSLVQSQEPAQRHAQRPEARQVQVRAPLLPPAPPQDSCLADCESWAMQTHEGHAELQMALANDSRVCDMPDVD